MKNKNEVELEIEMHAELETALIKARKRHPVFAENDSDAIDAIADELEELKYAVSEESEKRQRAEAMDIAVTAIRFWLGEQKNN